MMKSHPEFNHLIRHMLDLNPSFLEEHHVVLGYGRKQARIVKDRDDSRYRVCLIGNLSFPHGNHAWSVDYGASSFCVKSPVIAMGSTSRILIPLAFNPDIRWGTGVREIP